MSKLLSFARVKAGASSLAVPLLLLGMTLPTSAMAADPPPGMLAHFESWIALAIVGTAVLTAWMLNNSAPKVRAFGTMLAGLACLAIVAWFVQVLGSGILEQPKPNQTPMDALKPTLLWAQASVALIAGFVLLVTAYRQRKQSETLVLGATNEPERYGRVSRVLHWTTAILFITLIPMGIFTSMIPVDAWFRTEYYVVHKTIGSIVLSLLVFRLVWNQYSKRPSLDSSLTKWERRLAHAVHVGLYILMIAVPLSGFIMTTYHGYPLYFFAIEIPPLWEKNHDATMLWGLFHKYVFHYLIYIILGAHVLGALKHYFIDQHDAALKRMVS